MNKKQLQRALEGHENAGEILEVLESPVEPHEHRDRHHGYVVGQSGLVPEDGPEDGQGTVHRLKHWEGGFKPEKYHERQRKLQKDRETHGLQFLERPNRKGRYAKATPGTRQRVRENYARQTEAESRGEHWEP